MRKGSAQWHRHARIKVIPGLNAAAVDLPFPAGDTQGSLRLSSRDGRSNAETRALQPPTRDYDQNGIPVAGDRGSAAGGTSDKRAPGLAVVGRRQARAVGQSGRDAAPWRGTHEQDLRACGSVSAADRTA